MSGAKPVPTWCAFFFSFSENVAFCLLSTIIGWPTVTGTEKIWSELAKETKTVLFFFQIKTIKGWNPFHRDKRVQPTATLSGAWTILPAVALPSVSAEESQSHEWQFSTLRCDYGNGRHCKRPDIKCWFMFIHDSKNVEMIHLLDYHPREGFYSFYPASVERENFLKLALCRRRKTIW